MLIKDRLEKTSIVLLFSLALYCLVAIFITPVSKDEKSYHYPNAQRITLKGIVNQDSSYSSAYPPLPYLIGNQLLKLYNSIYVLRLLNFVMAVFLAYVLFVISKAISQQPFTITLLIVSNPYLLRSAFTYHMFNYGLLMASIGIYFYFFSRMKRKRLLSHFAFGSAILFQQWMIVVAFSIFWLDLFKALKPPADACKIAKNIGLKFLVLLPPFCLFISWRGFTHPNFQSHSLQPSFEHLTGTLANWGLIAGLIALFNVKFFFKRKSIPLILSLPLIYFSVPEHSMGHGIRVITGGAAQIAKQTQHYLLVPYQLTFVLFAFLGLMAFLLILNKGPDFIDIFLKLSLVGFLAAFSASSRLSAAHVFISMPFLIMIFRMDIFRNPVLKYLFVSQCYGVSLLYVSYYVFFVTRGMGLLA